MTTPSVEPGGAPTSTSTPSTLNINVPPQQSPPQQYFTAEDLERARQQEKDKLYKDRERQQQLMETMRGELDTLNSERQAREAEEKRRADEVAKAKKDAEEAELSAKEVLAKRDEEYKAELARMQGQLEQQNMLFAKEREFQELKAYAQQRMNENRGKIIPELEDLVTGNTKEEIDASIERVVAKTAAIMEGVDRMQTVQRQGQQGPSVTGTPPAGPIDGVGQQEQLTPEQWAERINNMGAEEYANFRQQVGFGGQQSETSMDRLWSR